MGVVVVTGSGRAFSAGGDLEGYLTLYRDEVRFRGLVEPGQKLVIAVRALEVRRRFCKFDFQGFVGLRRVVEGRILGMRIGGAGDAPG